jgi:hypothetical protein
MRAGGARLAHFGVRRFCPCCHSHVRRFMPFGEVPRPEARCPVCGALERHRLATVFLNEREDLLRGARRVLHVAPEPPVAEVLRRTSRVHYVSVDFGADDAMVQADLMDMPFGSWTFDAIYCSHVLEHVTEDARAMAEMHRVLRPGGWAMIQVPIKREVTFEDPTIRNPEVRRRLFGQPDHVRVYGQDFTDRLKRARFAVSVEQPQQRLAGETVARCGLNASESLFLCEKAPEPGALSPSPS